MANKGTEREAYSNQPTSPVGVLVVYYCMLGGIASRMRCSIAWRFQIEDISCFANSSSCFGFPHNVFMNFVEVVTGKCGGQRKYPHFLVYLVA